MSARLVGVRIDIETKSREDVSRGAYRYSECPDFEVQILAYQPIRVSGNRRMLGKIRTLDLYNQQAVDQFAAILLNPKMEKHAFNANFERVCLSRWLGMPTGEYLDPKNWFCTAVRANVNGVFGSLDAVAKSLRSPILKDSEGKALIRFFGVPDRKTGEFNDPVDFPEKFTRYETYCERDVETEAGISALLPDIPKKVQREYENDQRANDRGILHHGLLSAQAVVQVAREKDRLMGVLKALTGLENPNSNKQMGEWLEAQGYPMTSLDKAHRAEAVLDPACPAVVKRVLEMKGAASLSSVSKHNAALNTRSEDGRIRGSLQFYGAHTGREAGRGIQPQNLPRYEAPEEDVKRLLKGKAGSDAPEIAKGTVRASLVPARKHLFVTVDYNAIEARVLGWLAGEKWVNEEFRGAGKIYEATAATMFGADKAALVAALNLCGKCGACPDCDLRNKGKVSNLGLGYAGGAGALVTMGAEDAGINIGNYAHLNAEWVNSGSKAKFHEWERERHDYPELLRLRDLYRSASPATVGFWKHCGVAWDAAALRGKGTRFGDNGVVQIIRDGRHNRMILPSGRSIWYRFARSHADDKNPDRIDARTFMGKGAQRAVRVETHGGKLCISGDALTLTDRGWVPLRTVLPTDRVWDGVNFVAQDGLVFKGVKPVIDIEGVRMTPDHQIMQTGGWREAQQYDRSDWQDVGLPDGAGLLALGASLGRSRGTPDLAGAMHLWNGVHDAEGRSPSGPARGEGASTLVRLPAGGSGFQNHLTDRGWSEQAPAVRTVAHGEVPLHESDRPGVGQLRRAWDHHVRPLAARFLGVRRGHGSDAPTGADARPSRQRWAVRTRELPVGHVQGAGEQQEAVYDLLNCGPLNRFTVLTERGPMLVHNCENITQAVARDVLFALNQKIEKRTKKGWPGRLVLHVHDEVVLEVPKKQADQVLADVKGWMGESPKWAPGLILKGEGDIMDRYRK